MKHQEVYAYTRTSNLNTKDGEASDSQSRQMRAIRAFCRKRGFKVAQTFHDSVSGDSGTDLSCRVSFAEMLDIMEEKGVKVFVVENPMRYARSIITSAIITDKLNKLGIDAYDASTGNILTNKQDQTAEEQLVKNILMCVAEFEKISLVNRLQAGKRKAKREGKYIGGVKAFGSLKEDQAAFARVAELRQTFRDEEGRMTKTRIAKILERENFKNRRGKPYSVQSVTRIINEFM